MWWRQNAPSDQANGRAENGAIAWKPSNSTGRWVGIGAARIAATLSIPIAVRTANCAIPYKRNLFRPLLPS